MSGSGELYERDEALAAMAMAAEQARSGGSAAVFIVGHPGLGKTTLLDHAELLAGEARVVRAAGTAGEAVLPFGYFSQVLRPLGGPDGHEALQRHASVEARASLFYDALQALGAAAQNESIVILLDDLHWADPDSLDLLRFVVTRIEATPIAVIGALRPWPGSALAVAGGLATANGARTIHLNVLSKSASSMLLKRESPRRLSKEDVDEALGACSGNPLLLKYVAARLHRSDAPTFVPSNDRLLVSQFGALSGTTLRTAQVASVLGSRFPVGLVACVMGATDEEVIAAIVEMEHAELVRGGAGEAEFLHPLFAQALYDDLSELDRAQLHRRAMQEIVKLDGSVMEAAKHAREGVRVHDAESLAVLERAGHVALQSGGIESARLNLRAAAEASGADPSPQLRLDLAEAELSAGNPEEAERVCAPLTAPGNEPDLRVRAHILLVKSAIAAVRPDRAENHFEHGMLAAGEDATLCCNLLRAVEPEMTVVSAPNRRLRWAGRFRSPGSGVGRAQQIAVDLTVGLLEAACGNPRAIEAFDALSLRTLDIALQHASPQEQAYIAVNAIHLAILIERFDDAALAFDFSWRAAKRAHSPYTMMHVATAYADALCRRGMIEECLALIDEVDEAANGIPGVASFTALPRAAVALQVGDLEFADALCTGIRLLLASWPDHFPILWLWLEKFQAELHLERGETREAGRCADSMLKRSRSSQVLHPLMVPWADIALAAYVRQGLLAEVERLVAHLEEVSMGWPGRWPLAVIEAGRAALAEASGDLAAAQQHHLEAVDRLEGTGLPLALSQALVEYGRFLRRRGRSMEARQPLRRALKEAGACGAKRYEAIAAAELRACGGRRSSGSRSELSPRESEVAALAAAGYSNGEIAAKLVLSVRTIEHHLQAVYRKEGIRSRKDLRGTR